MINYTIYTTLHLWKSYRPAKSEDRNLDKLVSIALRQHIIPKLDEEVNELSIKEFADYSYRQSVKILKDAMSVLEVVLAEKVEAGEIKMSTANNYRWALNKFMQWLMMQPWWQSLWVEDKVKVTPILSKLPPQPKRKKKGTQICVALKLSNLPEYLLSELEEYRLFRTKAIPPSNQCKNLLSELSSNHSDDVEEDVFINHDAIQVDEGEVDLSPHQSRNYTFIRKPKLEKLKSSTYQKEVEHILYFWGYLQQFSPEIELHLSLMTDVDLLDDFVYWVIDNRYVSHSTGVNMANTAIAICKFNNYHRTKRRNWSDIQQLRDLQNLRNEYREEYELEKKQLESEKWANKELTHSQARDVVNYLRHSCASRNSLPNRTTGERTFSSARKLSAVARAWQTYILVKLLVYCPVRQEEIRYLVYGESLLRKVDSQGNVSYEVFLEEHKLDYTGEPRHYRLPDIIRADLDYWIFNLLPQIRGAVQDVESWLKFWGYPLDKVEGIERKIKDAQAGILPSRTKRSQSEYIKEQQRLLKAAQRRISAFELAKANLEEHDLIFIMFGKHVTEAFGKPLDVATVWITVRRAIAKASFALFKEAKWTNPHALRHIAEKHLRMIGKGDLADAFGALIGHSGKMGAEYAAQITTELEITKDIVDNWWLE